MRPVGKPAALATTSSPSEQTSSERPSSATQRAIARHQNALLAQATSCGAMTLLYSRQRTHTCSSSSTYAGVPKRSAISARRTPPTDSARLGHAGFVTQVRLETIRIHARRHLHPHQRVQSPGTAYHADTEAGGFTTITPGSTWIRVTPSGASMSRMASALICIHG